MFLSPSNFNLLYFNATDYLSMLQFQEQLFHYKIDEKEKGKKSNNFLLFLEHQHVYTLGKSGDERNLKIKADLLDATFVNTNRGGDITYHGPGQLVVYPIFDLDDYQIGVRKYVESLEQTVIDCIADYGLKGERISDASGVWLGVGSSEVRKICAIGIKVSRGICMHGLAFNINTDLSYFKHIVPCGITDKGVTSLEKELNRSVCMQEIQNKFIEKWENIIKS